MTVASVICEGFGPGASLSGVVLEGYSIGAPAAVAVGLITEGLGLGPSEMLIREGFSSFTGVPDPPVTNKQYTNCTLTNWSGDSLQENQTPAVVVGDIFVTDIKTTPGNYPVTVNGDGTVVINALGDTTRQSFQADIFDASLSTDYGAFTVYINNHAPVVSVQPPDISIFLGNAIPTIAFTAPPSPYVTDQDGDPLTSVLLSGSLPTGVTLANNVLSGIATSIVSNPIVIQFSDPIGATANLTMNLTVGSNATVPNVVGLQLSVAQADITAAGLTSSFVPQGSTAPFGQIISQSPAAGTNVVGGSNVALIMSTGSLTPVQTTITTIAATGQFVVSEIFGQFKTES